MSICLDKLSLYRSFRQDTWKSDQKKNSFSHYYVSRGRSSFFKLYFWLVTRLESSRYCRAIFNILTSQKRGEIELRFVRSVNRSLVNTTGESPKFIFCLVQRNPENTKHLGNSKLVGIYREVWEIECKITVFDWQRGDGFVSNYRHFRKPQCSRNSTVSFVWLFWLDVQ